MTSDEAGTVHPDRVREAMAPQPTGRGRGRDPRLGEPLRPARRPEPPTPAVGHPPRRRDLRLRPRPRRRHVAHRDVAGLAAAAHAGLGDHAARRSTRALPPQRRHRPRPPAPARRDPQRTPEPDLTTLIEPTRSGSTRWLSCEPRAGDHCCRSPRSCTSPPATATRRPKCGSHFADVTWSHLGFEARPLRGARTSTSGGGATHDGHDPASAGIAHGGRVVPL